MKIVKKIVSVIFDLAFAGFAFFLFFNLAFLFGHLILDGNPVGNDSAFALSLVYWFERWWPKIPLWFPQQGVGVSLFHSYPMLPTFLVIFTAKMTELSLLQSYKFFSFITFPLTALGVYFLTKRFCQSRTAGFLAGVLFLLSQASWVFLRLHGIFAQSFSMIFVPFIFLFFDRGISSLKEKKKGFGIRLNWVLASLFLALCFLVHPVTGIVTSGAVLFYTFWVGFLAEKKMGWQKRLARAGRALVWVGGFMILGLGLIAFWFVPFSFYNHLANREGLNTMGLSQLREVSLLPSTLLGLHDFATGDLRYDYFFFALPVWLLFGLGLLVTFLINKRLFFAGVLAILALVYTTAPLYLEWLVKPFTYFFTAVYFRALILPIVFLPVVGAGGLREFWHFVFGWWLRFLKTTNKAMVFILRGLVGLVVGLAVIVSGFWLIKTYSHRPPDKRTKEFLPYGVVSFEAYGPTLDEDWKKLLIKPEYLLERPKVEITNKSFFTDPYFLASIEELKFNQFDRVDTSPVVLGGNLLQYATMFTEASFINLYHFFASLTHGMWGYQAGVFFGQEPLFEEPKLLEELTKWYGAKYVYVTEGWDRTQNYEKVGYQLVKKVEDRNTRFDIYKYPQSTGLAEISDKPAVLVIGDFAKGAYEQVFRMANLGVFSYDEVLMVEGTKRIDDYDLKELKRFDFLILHGYGYRNKKAWGMVEKYLQEGGKVFIESGWQFVAKDWGDRFLPEPLPIKKTSWTKVGPSWEKVALAEEYQEGIDFAKFNPLAWEDDQWGVAAAEKTSLRSETEVILKIGEKILMAKREVGQGKIVWSGMNIIFHLQEPKLNKNEALLLRKIFEELGIGKRAIRIKQPEVLRDYPDRVEILPEDDFSGESWLLWKESFTPQWRVRFLDNKKRLKKYRAGPGFLLVWLPKLTQGEKIELVYQLSLGEGKGAIFVSLMTALFLLFYLFFSRTQDYFARVFWQPIKVKILTIKKSWAQEEGEY